MENLFVDQVSTATDLQKLMGEPSKVASQKVINYLDQHCQDFISKSPLVLISTSDTDGNCDVSPRGDEMGFARIVDDKHLLIPERPGNRRVDSLKNILTNANAGLLFLIPGLEETLRINGSAWITKNEELLSTMSVLGRPPVVGIVIKVDECFIHCAKALKRSQLWKHETWVGKEDLPKAAKILSDHARLNQKEVEDVLHESYTKRLY